MPARCPSRLLFALLLECSSAGKLITRDEAKRLAPPKGGQRLQATLDLAWLHSNGTLFMPPDTMDILIEIGANSRNTMDLEVMPNRTTSYLLTFEPILDKFATLLSRNSRADTKSILGRHHQRGTVLPYAVGKVDGFATFNLSPVDGCSSLLKAHRSRNETRYGPMADLCAPIESIASEAIFTEERRVPTISLQTVLSKWLAWDGGGGWPISFMKIDAQGFDTGIFDSIAGTGLVERIQAVSMETRKDGCRLLYETTGSSPHCGPMVHQMAKYGFKPDLDCRHTAFNKECEADIIFRREGVRRGCGERPC